jgi:hypothetical protein
MIDSAAEFLDAIRKVTPPGNWKILVVDDHSQKLLGAVLKQFDILEEKVTCACLTTPEFSVSAALIEAFGVLV